MLVERAAFYQAEAMAQNVKDRAQQVGKKGELIDYLTFVPDGEPTLDADLGAEIELLRPLGIKIAVITNASLIWREDVRRDLQQANWVSLKIDTVSEETWRLQVEQRKGSEFGLEPNHFACWHVHVDCIISKSGKSGLEWLHSRGF
jgi:wyosine [tRNA(Phe)-imidazoG37] synthetase (radical SAM superfamily)